MKYSTSILASALFLSSNAAVAQTPRVLEPLGANGPSASTSSANDAQKQDAKSHFDKGIALFEEEAWDAALTEFNQSRALYPTRSATNDAGICLRKLHRFDEAIEMFEALLKFSSLSPDEREVAQAQVRELSDYVGTLTLQGVEAGTRIVIDGRERGDAPIALLRVSAGTHVLRAERDGFAAFEAQVTIAGGKNTAVPVKLLPLLQGGRLKVEEATGRNIDVLVDGSEVGKTPWEGVLPVGPHVVTLRGEGNLGVQPSPATVRLNASTQLTLRAELLPVRLRVQPTPLTATVILDGAPLGRGVWTGNVRRGDHVVEVWAEGYATETRRVAAEVTGENLVDVQLRRVAEQSSGHPFFSAEVALLLGGSLGGDLECNAGCSKGGASGVEVLGRGGYELPSGLAMAIDAGFLRLASSLKGRAVSLQPVGLAANQGSADDKLAVSGLLVGISAHIHRGEQFPLSAGLGAGMILGTLKDDRSAAAATNERTKNGATIPSQSYSFSLSESPAARYFYLAPELRAGLRLAKRFEISLGVRALILVAVSTPQWTDERKFDPGAAYAVGPLAFGSQRLTSDLTVAVAPSLGARLDF